eukprot:9191378-Pyramimonas_sp.AAC.1
MATLVLEKKSNITEGSERETILGEWLNYEQIVVAQGGWGLPAAQRGAMSFLVDAISKGGRWIRMNPRSKRLEFEFVRETDDAAIGAAWQPMR